MLLSEHLYKMDQNQWWIMYLILVQNEFLGTNQMFALLIQPTISLEMPVPSQGHYGFPSFLVVDWCCLFIYLWILTFPLEDCSEFGNLVITLIEVYNKQIIACHFSYHTRSAFGWINGFVWTMPWNSLYISAVEYNII